MILFYKICTKTYSYYLIFSMDNFQFLNNYKITEFFVKSRNMDYFMFPMDYFLIYS